MFNLGDGDVRSALLFTCCYLRDNNRVNRQCRDTLRISSYDFPIRDCFLQLAIINQLDQFDPAINDL